MVVLVLSLVFIFSVVALHSKLPVLVSRPEQISDKMQLLPSLRGGSPPKVGTVKGGRSGEYRLPMGCCHGTGSSGRAAWRILLELAT